MTKRLLKDTLALSSFPRNGKKFVTVHHKMSHFKNRLCNNSIRISLLKKISIIFFMIEYFFTLSELFKTCFTL
jgi:hypothetical protein